MQLNLPVLSTVIAAHIALLLLLIAQRAAPMLQELQMPLVVDLLPVAAEEPPAPVEPDLPPPPLIYVPPPVVIVAVPPSPFVVAESPPPPELPSVSPPPRPAPPAPATIATGDLSATTLSATAPRYPLESRRRREQGTVMLSLLLGEDGRVAEIEIARTSGHRRLDEVALAAVRRWRWLPTVRNGRPVQVRGVVEIPFILTG
ncbi:energy transducer TonB [Sphingoaurantiacus capsulatus]|uniref:Energy transducer TonB n=1 Tax=Sphingoaurantiacus capsulatus TaxID=1771310 RepID=A0ABV7XA42_9SPHN